MQALNNSASQKSSLKSGWLSVLGVLLFIVGQTLWYVLNDLPLLGGVVVIGAAVVVFLAPTPLMHTSTRVGSPITNLKTSKPSYFRKLFIPIGVGLVIFAAQHGVRHAPGSLWVLLALWLCGLGCVLIGITQYGDWLDLARQVFQSLAQQHREWLGIACLMGLGLIIRGGWLGSFPDMMAEDEGHFAKQAAEIQTYYHWERNPFEFTPDHHPVIYHIMQAVSIDMFGRTVAAARLPSAILGTLTIGAVYWVVRLMFDQRVAVLAGIFMTTFPQHVHFSRLALNQVMDPLFLTLSFGFLILALRNDNRAYYALTGLTMGLSQYGFSSARLIPILVVIYLFWHYLSQKKRSGEPDIFPILSLAFVFAVTVFPQAYSLWHSNSGSPSPRLEDIGIWQKDNPFGVHHITHGDEIDYWEKQLTAPFLGFTQQQEAGYFYGRFAPFLGWVAPVPFMIGLVLALKNWRNPKQIILVWGWGLTVVLGGILLSNPPEFQRFVISIPALVILVSLGVLYMADVLVWLSKTLSPEQLIPVHIERWILPLILTIALSTFDLKIYSQDYRLARPYFHGPRTTNLNIVADEVLPKYIGYRIWYMSAPDLNLATSPVLEYKVPNLSASEYGGKVQDLPIAIAQSLADNQTSLVVILAPHYPDFAAAYELLSTVSGGERWAVPDPITYRLVAYVFKFSVE
ncbi:MAG: glycosyltransferase family 39 protein [Chloroflexi bacterium]|nr:glycosyltransferase family 39 protein [Chloroflexota bacterium]